MSDTTSPKSKQLFNFEGELVQRAIGGDSHAFEKICTTLMQGYDAVKRKIQSSYPDMSLEFYDKVLDLFIDRVLRIFSEPPEDAIENFNGLCATLLKRSTYDAFDWFSAGKRDRKREIQGDMPIGEDSDSITFIDTISTEVAGQSFGSQSSIFSGLDRAVLQENIKAALATLKPSHRKVIRLWMEGYTEKEIAAETEMTTSNIGSIVSRTIKRLRTVLQEDGTLVRHKK